MNIPMTANAWDLYSKKPGAEEAAVALGTALQTKLTDALAAGQGDMAAAIRIRDEMYVLMNGYSDLGARDTEPETVLVAVIERGLGLAQYSLTR